MQRITKETRISADLDVYGRGEYEIDCILGFFGHMLEAFAKHGLFDLKMQIAGDLEVDQHHTVEDTGLVLGREFRRKLGDMKGIARAGYFVFPMDEALAVVSIDISGRPYLQFDAEFKRRFCGDLDTDVIEDFFQAFAAGLGANVVVRMPYGRSDHHKIEAIFKAFARAMKMACAKEERAGLPTTKGVIDDNDS